MYLSNLTNIQAIQKSKCQVVKGFIPNIKPVIVSFLPDTSLSGNYTVVHVTGENFTRDTTSVIFGSKKDIDITYYSSSSISFVVPMNYPKDIYDVQVRIVNNKSIVPNFLYSNTLMYILT